MKTNIKIILLILFSQFGFSQQKSLVNLTAEISNRIDSDKTNYVIISRTTTEMIVNEKDQSSWQQFYTLYVIADLYGKPVVEKYENGKKSQEFELNDSKIFSFLKNNIRKVKSEKFKNYEYDNNGSKIYPATSDPSEMEIKVFFDQLVYHNKFKDYLLEFSTNSKLKLVNLISLIVDELEPHSEHHPFLIKG